MANGFMGEERYIVKIKGMVEGKGVFGEGSGIGFIMTDIVFVLSDTGFDGIFGLANVGSIAIRGRAGDAIHNIG